MLRVFTGGDIAVMTTGTIAGDIAVVECGRDPGRRGVADIALLAGRQVVGVFSYRYVAVMAA